MLAKLILVFVVLTFVGCSGGSKKVEVPQATFDETQRVKAELNNALNQHMDVLAHEEFQIAKNRLNEAQEEILNDRSNEKILQALQQSKLSLKAGHELLKQRRPHLEGVIKTRQMAIAAGARSSPQSEPQLARVDEELIDQIGDLDNLTPQAFSKLQSQYMDLELLSIKRNHLEKTSSALENARNELKAKKVAPKTLKKAELALTNAENMIAAHRGKPENYKEAVAAAIFGAQLLSDVLNVATREDGNLNEDTALNIVMQNRRINNLQGQLGQAELEKKKLGQTIESQGQQMVVAGAALRMQKAIESARKSFTKQEAEVYQQGEKLLIRLKAMNFASGRTDLPASSLTLLAKVKNVISGLGAQEIVIEGHTDSVGGASNNDQLSQARAEAIAHYLETSGIDVDKIKAVGYGFKKPIASNKTKFGRSQNRRVDLIVTPTQYTKQQALLSSKRNQ